MAGDWAKQVTSGQKWEPTAQWVNNVTAAARARLSSRTFGGAAGRGSLPEGLIWVQNNSGADRDVTDVLGVDSILFDYQANPNEFLYRWSVNGVTPSFPTHLGNFVVCMEPIAKGAMGRAYIAGVCPAYVNVLAAGDNYADITNGDPSQLTSGDIGQAQILLTSGTGPQWTLVRLGTINLGMFPVSLTHTSGDGSPGSPWVYTAKSFSGGFTYGTGLSPEFPVWGNNPTAATIGMGRYDNTATFKLTLAGAGRNPTNC